MRTFTYVIARGPTTDGRAELTNEHTPMGLIPVLSWYVEGRPVAHLSPADPIRPGRGEFTCADAVRGWAMQPGRTPDELEAAHWFLRQWDAGPQLPLDLFAVVHRKGGA